MSLLKTDTASRYSAYQTALSSGFLTVDEIREYENLDPMDHEDEENDVAEAPEDSMQDDVVDTVEDNQDD
jgi:phage portal protein BeeE